MMGGSVDATDDVNHLLLSCRLSSELGTGLRYAYSRLDTIDRKASELFRSFTWIFSLLGGLTTLGSRPFRWSHGNPSGLQLIILIGFMLLIPIVILMTVLHKSISGLRYYRIGTALLDAATLPVDSAHRLVADNPQIADYIREISQVTVRRERQLAIMGRLHSAGLGICGVLLISLVAFSTGPAAECPCGPLAQRIR